MPGTNRSTIAEGTLLDWLYAYRKGGLEALKPKCRTDKGTTRAIPPDIAQAILLAKQHKPRLTVKSILKQLVDQGLITAHQLAPATVYRHLAAHLPKTTTSKIGRVCRRFEHRFPNDCWQGDTMHGPYLKLDGLRRPRKTDVAAQVSAAIAELADQHKIATVLGIDEAHLLKPELLDEVRLVHNAQFDSTDKLATALVGQPALRKTVDLHRFLPLRQRITVSAHLGPLSNEEAQAYIQHQLDLVAPTIQIFHPQALNTIIAASKGVPRLINAIAIKAMTHAAENKHSSVEQQTVLHVLDEMGMN